MHLTVWCVVWILDDRGQFSDFQLRLDLKSTFYMMFGYTQARPLMRITSGTCASAPQALCRNPRKTW